MSFNGSFRSNGAKGAQHNHDYYYPASSFMKSLFLLKSTWELSISKAIKIGIDGKPSTADVVKLII
jgi:hypothetical protein